MFNGSIFKFLKYTMVILMPPLRVFYFFWLFFVCYSNVIPSILKTGITKSKYWYCSMINFYEESIINYSIINYQLP